MTAEQKAKYIKFLKIRGSYLDRAIVFYLTSTNQEFEKKKQFVEKILDKYTKIYSVSCGRYKEWVNMSIPQEVILKLVEAYDKDFAEEQQKVEDEDAKELIAEMNEIF